MEAITRRVNRIKQLTADCAQTAPPAPKSVKIELTARCDFECFFCASHTRPRQKSDMPREFFERIVAEMRGLGVEQLGVFYLGESFLCDWLPDAIRYAKQPTVSKTARNPPQAGGLRHGLRTMHRLQVIENTQGESHDGIHHRTNR